MTSRQKEINRAGRCAGAASLLLILLAGCSDSLGEVDRVFLSAAGSWDRDRDGTVTCLEWQTYAGELFDSADANRDGAVDTAEYGTITRTDRMFQTVEFKYYDVNGDGKIARTEFVDKPNRAFELLDKNKSCVLTASQVAGARAHTEQVFEKKKPESGDPREKGIPGVN